jgi:hypothetical protein
MISVESERENPGWEASWALAVGTIAGSAVLALLPAMLSATLRRAIFGLPAVYFLAGVVVPPLLALGVFAFAALQDRLDRRFGSRLR